MSKYDRLWAYIREHAPDELRFEQVEEICGFPIDHSFLKYKKELEAHGYRIGKISMKAQTVKVHPLK